MPSMFDTAVVFNGLLSSFVTSRVTTHVFSCSVGAAFSTSLLRISTLPELLFFTAMFRDCDRFNQPLPWVTKSGTEFVSIGCDDGTR